MLINRSLLKLTSAYLFLFACIAISSPYKELVRDFNQSKSKVCVRQIDTPTLAALDLAAYDKNPILYDPRNVEPRTSKIPILLKDITFGGELSEMGKTIDNIPLTEAERQKTLAWKPLVKRLWNVVKVKEFSMVSGKIEGYKWADSSVYQPYQEISEAFIHENNGKFEIWVKVQFKPWVNFLKDVNDNDRDDCGEIYGRLTLKDLKSDSLLKAVDWIRNEYCGRVLSREEMVDWLTELVSYWYPSKNTDLVILPDNKRWPDKKVGRILQNELKGMTFKDPLGVIEGKPLAPDKPVYNVFLVKTDDDQTSKVITKSAERDMKSDSVTSVNISMNKYRFQKETDTFGNYVQWKERNTPFFDGIKNWVNSFPKDQLGFEGKDGWLFFRKSFDYLLGGDLTGQPQPENPLPQLINLKNYLHARCIDLLFVAVPCKEEIYFDRLSDSIGAPQVSLINPFIRKFLKECQDSGVEVIDIFPSFLDAERNDSISGETVYQKQDTHWTSRGIQIAADLISSRIKLYSWYPEMKKQKFGYHDTSVLRLGDIVERLPESRRGVFPPAHLNAKQVIFTDGTLYKGSAESPILLIGDSFTGVFESIEPKSAGIGSHIVAKTGLTVDIITSWGGGPSIRKKALTAREKFLGYKKVLIYLMTTRDLYNYPQGWEQFP